MAVHNDPFYGCQWLFDQQAGQWFETPIAERARDFASDMALTAELEDGDVAERLNCKLLDRWGRIFDVREQRGHRLALAVDDAFRISDPRGVNYLA